MSTKKTLINWFMDISRSMMLSPRVERRVEESDIRKMAEFHSRIMEICEGMGERYSPYDWTRKNKSGSWVFSSSGFLLWIFGNHKAISRVSELRPTVDAYNRMQESIAARNKMHPAAYKNDATYYNDLHNESVRCWTQMKLAFGEGGGGDSTPPCGNTGGEK